MWNGNSLKAVVAASFIGMAASAEAADRKISLTLPYGETVSIDCSKLGPRGELTLEFLGQFDPHHPVHGNPRSSDREETGRAIMHLKSHGITPEQIGSVLDYCRS